MQIQIQRKENEASCKRKKVRKKKQRIYKERIILIDINSKKNNLIKKIKIEWTREKDKNQEKEKKNKNKYIQVANGKHKEAKVNKKLKKIKQQQITTKYINEKMEQ